MSDHLGRGPVLVVEDDRDLAALVQMILADAEAGSVLQARGANPWFTGQRRELYV